MDNDIAIKVENLSKAYKLYDKPIDRLKEAMNPFKKKYHKDFFALDNTSFQLKRGEVVGIVGKNGSGKSTMLKIITGVLSPSSGVVEVNGRVSALLELGAGFNPELTGTQNIYLNGTMMGYSQEEMEKRIPNIIEFADIGDFINQPVKTYSSGMFVRLAFAVAINVDPDILIIDEALAVGDIRFQLKCMDKFDDFREKKITILFASHDINAIKRFCTQCIWIHEGHIAYWGKTDLCTDKYLDYLKNECNDSEKESRINKENQMLEHEKNSIRNKEIAEILSVNILDKRRNIIENIQFEQEVFIEVAYNVNDLSIIQPVLGIAIRSIDHQYICGLNTKLDDFNISWNEGLNYCYLHYHSFNLVGGSYYFDVAIFDKNATVLIDYKSMYKKFFMHTPYKGEGIYIIPHNWYLEGDIQNEKI